MRPIARLLLALTLWLPGCKGEHTAGPAGAPQASKATTATASAAAAAAIEAAAKATDDPAVSTARAEHYEALLLALAKCPQAHGSVQPDCPEFLAYHQSRTQPGTVLDDWYRTLTAVGLRHLKHTHSVVRGEAARLMVTKLGKNAKSVAALLEAAKVEQDPALLGQMLNHLMAAEGQNPEVRALVLASARHADAKVRASVAWTLTSKPAVGWTEALDQVMALAEKDTDKTVRAAACQRLGLPGDARVLPLFERLWVDPGTDRDTRVQCMNGIVAMWASPFVSGAPSEEAYRLTFKLLASRPRSAERPVWVTTPGMGFANRPRFEAVAPWYRPAELLAAIADVVADTSIGEVGRLVSLDAMTSLGATKADFETLEKAYFPSKDQPSPEGRIYEKVVKARAGAR